MYQNTPFQAAEGSSVYLGRYSTDGSFVDTVRVTHAISPVVASLAETGTSDGGTLFVGSFGTASPFMVRVSADGDILWTRYLSLGEWPTGFPPGFLPHDVVQLPEGDFAMCGNDVSAEGHSMAVVTFDGEGQPQCRISIGQWQPWLDTEPMASSAIELRSDGRLNVFYTLQPAGQPQQVFRSVIGDPCLSTGEQVSTADAPFTVWPTVTHGRVNIRRGDATGPYSITVMDPAGRSVFQGYTSADGSFDIQHRSPGIYLVRVEGLSVLQRILLH